MEFVATHTELKPCPVRHEYPYLGIHPDTKCIIFFVKKNTGICMDPGDSDEDVGFFCNNWDEKMFSPFYGKVTITSIK